MRRILDDRIDAFERLNFSHKCLLQALDQQPGDLRSQVDLAYRQLSQADPEAFKGSAFSVDREKEQLAEKAREIENRERDLERRQKELEEAKVPII